ncbi:hypothetical protein [Mangrovibacillus cuniculi]|uniref:Uncharacterized protein n=1 Tax=Mangrovibacillus cuniculi TaxID=2593652 RepID=A0A7S8CCF2_9BACI|nr:hypothetical protein [Mangrovibacillus cuniculi]QPC47432.1 hypothetical protein G8O30_10970 [Mangrovibacillus cuniculi]
MSSKQKWILAGVAYILLVISAYSFLTPNQHNNDDHAGKALMSFYS